LLPKGIYPKSWLEDNHSLRTLDFPPMLLSGMRMQRIFHDVGNIKRWNSLQ